MNYDEIKAGLERQAQRRKYFQEQLSKTDPYDPNALVSGRAIPYSPIQGLSKIAQAIINKQGMTAAEKKEDELNKELAKSREQAFQNVTDTYFGRDAVQPTYTSGQEMAGPPTQANSAVEANPVKAAMYAMQDPYLRDTGMGRSILPDTGRGAFSTYVDYTDPATGITRKAAFNSRAPAGQQLTELDGTPIRAQGLSTKDISLVAEGAGKKKFATDIAGREAEKIIERPQKDVAMSAQESKRGMLGGLFDQAKAQTSNWTTGISGKLTGWIPGMPGYDLNSTLATIKANIGFDRLQEMRDSSKTGGALGQVSERENTLLQQVWGDLDSSTSKDQFEKNLKRVEKQVNESWARVKKAYKQDYGVDYDSTGGSPNPPTEQPQAQPQILRFDAQGNIIQ